jgi:hypothetical protein
MKDTHTTDIDTLMYTRAQREHLFDACFDPLYDDLGPDQPFGIFDPWTREDYEAAKHDRRYDEHYDLNRKVSNG